MATEEPLTCAFPCRLCGVQCQIENSLYFTEYFGSKHMNKLRSEALERRKREDTERATAVGIESKKSKSSSAPPLHIKNSDCLVDFSTERNRLSREAEAVEELRRRKRLEEIMKRDKEQQGHASANSSGLASHVPPTQHHRGTASDRPLVKRVYFLCGNCKTVFVPDPFLMTPEQEKEEYDLHENLGEDEGYRAFLSRAVRVVTQHFEADHRVRETTTPTSAPSAFSPSSSPPPLVSKRNCDSDTGPKKVLVRGLDFGCGPGPTICTMLAERNMEASDGVLGAKSVAVELTDAPLRQDQDEEKCIPFYHVTNYDKYYSHSEPSVVDPAVLVDVGMLVSSTLSSSGEERKHQREQHVPNTYKFITATEVVEHLSDAGDELLRLWSLLSPPKPKSNLMNGLRNSTDIIAIEDDRFDSLSSILVIMTKRADIYGNGLKVAKAHSHEEAAGMTTGESPVPFTHTSGTAVTTEKFVNWHYKNDPTHITFFTDESFEWCRDVLFGGCSKCRLTIVGPDVVLFEKLEN